jgi:FkbH-like protein
MKTCLTISDFNAGNFNAYLTNSEEMPGLRVVEAPFGQVHQLLLDDTADCWAEAPDVVVVWTQPQAVIQSLGRSLMFEEVLPEKLLQEVDQFADLLLSVGGRTKSVLVPTWVLPSYDRGMGLLDFHHDIGIRNLLSRMNLRLAERLSKAPNFFVLNTQRWVEVAGSRSFTPKLWYMGKIAFGSEVFKIAAEEVKIVLRAVGGQAKKLIVLDLDDTLWGGVVGDVGTENLILGGHDPEGEALVDFQKSLKALTNRGILLGIVSKNEETTALDAIRNHPEMILKLEDFAGWRINWQDKAHNVNELVAELNLGLHSVVFIDDNPVERARVRESLPEVLVPEWPQDKTLYRKALLELSCFDTPSLTAEDRDRARMYSGERDRISLRGKVDSLEDWLHTLEINVGIEKLNEENLARAAQLLNKTSQMNLSTRRMTEAELAKWAKIPGHVLWTFRVSDKFGNLGLTGVLGMEVESPRARIVDFVLSCRVMGRKIEETMLATAIQHARSLNVPEVHAQYLPTSKNKPCLEFFKRSGLKFELDEFIFQWDTTFDFPFPQQIRLEGLIS